MRCPAPSSRAVGPSSCRSRPVPALVCLAQRLLALHEHEVRHDRTGVVDPVRGAVDLAHFGHVLGRRIHAPDPHALEGDTRLPHDRVAQPALPHVEAESAQKVPNALCLARRRARRALVDQDDRVDLLTRGLELTSHLEGDPGAGAVTTDPVGTMGLDGLDLAEVGLRHVLDPRVGRPGAVEPSRLKPVERLIVPQLGAEVRELQHADHVGRDVEERPARPERLDRDQRVGRVVNGIRAHHASQLGDGRRLEQRRDGHALACCACSISAKRRVARSE